MADTKITPETIEVTALLKTIRDARKRVGVDTAPFPADEVETVSAFIDSTLARIVDNTVIILNRRPLKKDDNIKRAETFRENAALPSREFRLLSEAYKRGEGEFLKQAMATVGDLVSLAPSAFYKDELSSALIPVPLPMPSRRPYFVNATTISLLRGASAVLACATNPNAWQETELQISEADWWDNTRVWVRRPTVAEMIPDRKANKRALTACQNAWNVFNVNQEIRDRDIALAQLAELDSGHDPEAGMTIAIARVGELTGAMMRQDPNIAQGISDVVSRGATL